MRTWLSFLLSQPRLLFSISNGLISISGAAGQFITIVFPFLFDLGFIFAFHDGFRSTASVDVVLTLMLILILFCFGTPPLWRLL
jgi:hypothetical protein